VYAECCGRFHAGADAPTAELLMRSRFSAFAVADAAYLLRTWDLSTRPRRLVLDETLTWTRLEIVTVLAGGPFDATGIVEFRAHYRAAKAAGVLHERSTFVRTNGLWFYVEG